MKFMLPVIRTPSGQEPQGSTPAAEYLTPTHSSHHHAGLPPASAATTQPASSHLNINSPLPPSLYDSVGNLSPGNVYTSFHHNDHSNSAATAGTSSSAPYVNLPSPHHPANYNGNLGELGPSNHYIHLGHPRTDSNYVNVPHGNHPMAGSDGQ